MPKNHVPLNVSIDPERKRQLEDVARRKELSVSGVVRIAVNLYLSEVERKQFKRRKKV
jgi:hypothetical protein